MARSDSSIAVVGTRNWLGVAEHLLRIAGYSSWPLRVERRWLFLRVLFSPRIWSAEAIHMVWGAELPASIMLAWILRKPLVWHWIGSDVPRFAGWRGWKRRLANRLARRSVVAHLADSPELAAELKKLGIDAEVCRLLPASIEAEVLPLPEKFRVLSYWFDDRRTFYGGEIILGAARCLPDVEFIIAGAEGRGAPTLPNVTYLGRLDQLEEIYARVSVFVRMPEHDSLSAMVLEALARGRYVICNKPFDECLYADSLDSLCAAIGQARSQSVPNRAGAAVVKSSFRLQAEAHVLARVYGRVLTP